MTHRVIHTTSISSFLSTRPRFQYQLEDGRTITGTVLAKFDDFEITLVILDSPLTIAGSRFALIEPLSGALHEALSDDRPGLEKLIADDAKTPGDPQK